MCGLVALVGPVPADVVRAAVAGASARGPHQHGWAARTATSWHVSAAPGPIALPRQTADVLIGHSRLATCGRHPGDAPPLDEAQPYVHGPHLVAHNGVLDGAPPGTVDSLLLLADLAEHGLSDALFRLLASPHPSAALLATDGRIYAHRSSGVHVDAHPLHVASGPTWAAASSAPLPAGRLVPAGSTTEVQPA